MNHLYAALALIFAALCTSGCGECTVTCRDTDGTLVSTDAVTRASSRKQCTDAARESESSGVSCTSTWE